MALCGFHAIVPQQFACRLFAALVGDIVRSLGAQVVEPEGPDIGRKGRGGQRRSFTRRVKLAAQRRGRETLAVRIDQQCARNVIVRSLARFYSLDQFRQSASDDDPKRLLCLLLGEHQMPVDDVVLGHA